jgi:hypothetical protein
MSKFVLKDSGTREQYSETGMLREAQEGRGRFDLLSPIAMLRLARIYEGGAKKYGDRNWEKGAPVSKFINSGLRHAFQALEGRTDEDHLVQAAWNFLGAAHVLEMIDRGKMPPEYNDLPDMTPVEKP